MLNGGTSPGCAHLASGTPRIATTYTYDTNGALRMDVLQYHRKFLYDGWNLVAEWDGGAGTLVRSFMWALDLSGSMQGAGGAGGLVSVKPSGAAAHFAAYDANGNVIALVDGSAGTVSANYEYSPFGETIRATGTMALTNPLRFSTKFTDDESDFLYYGYRYYNPATGRWLSRDPIAEKGGFNLYEFAGNSPVGLFDANGLDPLPGYPYPPPPTLPRQTDPVGFALCQRDFQSDGTLISAIVMGIGNFFGGEHTYVHYKECKDCKTQGWGFSGGPARPHPDEEKAFGPNDCKTCTRTESTLQHGSGKNKKGKDATDAEIVECIQNSPILKNYRNTFRNRYVCTTWANQATSECGLNCK